MFTMPNINIRLLLCHNMKTANFRPSIMPDINIQLLLIKTLKSMVDALETQDILTKKKHIKDFSCDLSAEKGAFIYFSMVL
jgi:hypothetical protein